jgi:glycosyltransferase involved in cell wall biosynthesis
MSNLAVSVVIPTYNRSHLIERALNSVVSQILPGDQIIVVDDDSTDNTAEIVARYGDRVSYVKIPNLGAGGARNYGVHQATCPLVAFLDSDDEWLPHKLSIQRALMEARPDVLFCFSNFSVVDVHGRTHSRFLIEWSKDYRSWDEILGPRVSFSALAPLPGEVEDFSVHVGDMSVRELQSAYILTSSLIVRRDTAGEALHFADDVSTYEDFECFARLSLKGPAAYLDCETARQYGHTGERLTDIADLRRSTANVKIIERVWGQNQDFQSKYAALYQQTIDRARREKINDLLAERRTSEARAETRLLYHPPAILRLAVWLPSQLGRTVLKVSSLVRPAI